MGLGFLSATVYWHATVSPLKANCPRSGCHPVAPLDVDPSTSEADPPTLGMQAAAHSRGLSGQPGADQGNTQGNKNQRKTNQDIV